MKNNFKTKLLSLLLAVLMLLPTMTPLVPAFAADVTTYILDPGSMADVGSSNKKAEGDTDTAGTDNFFTVHYKSGTKIEANAKSFLGFTSTKRIDFQGAITTGTTPSGAVSFTTQAAATVTLFWGCTSNLSQVGIYDATGKAVTQTSEAVASNGLFVSELSLDAEGTYFVGGMTSGWYLYKMEVTTKTIDKGPRADWSTVAAPSFASMEVNDEGKLACSINALVDHHGADRLELRMYDADGKLLSTAVSTSIKKVHNLALQPVESGTYYIEAVISRIGEVTEKTSGKTLFEYKLPLAAPFITIVSSLGGGKVEVIWNPTREAEKYNVYVNSKLYKTTEERSIVIEGLTENRMAQIAVEAIRGTEISAKTSTAITVGKENRGWDFVTYGPSTNKDTNDNYFNLGSDGSVTVFSMNGKGKIQPTGPDGLSYYYTAVPTDKNFVFRATAIVNKWKFSNGQDGFGLLAMDHVPSTNFTPDNFWSNLYMAASTKIEYRYEDIEDGGYELYTTDEIYGDKYTMKLGVGTISKTGINQDIIDRTTLGEEGLIVGQTGNLLTVVQTLEARAGLLGKKPGTYNIIGKYSNDIAPEGTLADEYLLTELTLEIAKTNTGYFITYYDKNGEIVRKVKNYEADALEQFDKDFVYIGMFASRNAHVTFKDISLTTSDAATDPGPEERPKKKIVPRVTVTSATSTTTTDYNLVADFNVAGTVDIYMNDSPLVKGIEVKANERINKILDISEVYRTDLPNGLRIVFTPDPDQVLPYEHSELASTTPVWFNMDIQYYKGNYHRKNIYVAPEPIGMYYGTGSKEHPLDIYTAIRQVVPGQTIILMEGTYKLDTGLRIERGINGTEENPIRMIADPEAKTRPVLDFMDLGTGLTHGGNYWYFYGFDVTNTLDGYKGIQVSGNNNVLDQIHTYYNGNTGIQISRYHVVDITKDQWPANNLVLNCTSWGNADAGYEDADGFAAKLTIGDGNVFDGCVAHHNADDGWDLYAKIATGPIGAVVIKNCVAYGNGYLEDGTVAGNGNGFKMGGDSLTGKHQLINSIAFNNRAKGIDSNSCPDIIVKDCISYNNESHNVAFYTNSASNTDYVADGIISIKDNNIDKSYFEEDEKIEPKGNQDTDKYEKSSCYYWNGAESVNKAGQKLTTDIFVSTEFKGITRNADGSINMQGFLELNEKAPADAGTTGDSTPSREIVLLENEKCTYAEEWTTTDMFVHWHECECGDRGDLGLHNLQYIIDVEETDDQPGYKHNECTICGHKRPTIEIPPRNAILNQAPNFFTDFFGWWAWLFKVIAYLFSTWF